MKAVLYHTSGGPEVLEYVDVADPEPAPADVVIDVAATALNRLDVVQRCGWFHMPGFSYPHIAGMDVVGTVAEVGASVVAVAPGDRVVVDPSLASVEGDSKFASRAANAARDGASFGERDVLGATVDGGYAEKCLVPASHCYLLPDDMSFEKAATFPTCYLTAGHGLFEVGELRAGESVLIHAAGSGLSVAAIQLAKNAGATVLATAGRDDKCDRALEIGADHVLNNRTGDIVEWCLGATRGRGVDMVFDHVGAALFERSLASLAMGGRIVVCGNTSGGAAVIPSLAHLHHHAIRILGSDAYRSEEMGQLWKRFCTGDFEAVIDSAFPLAEAGRAQQKMLDDDFFGKILLRP